MISDPDLVLELFEKRAANYSDREENAMANLTGWNTDILFLHYGPTLKRYRTMLNRALNNRVATDYIPLQQHEVQKLMMRLIEEPKDFMSHIRLLAASIAIRLAYGHKVESYDDQFVRTAEKHMEGFSDMQEWHWMVNVFPILRYLPDWPSVIPFRRRAAEIKQVVDAHREKPFAAAQEQMAAGTAEISFVSRLLQSEDGGPVDHETSEHVKCVASTLYAAGSDTTVSAVQSFFLAMTLYPEVQAKAKAEVTSFLNQRLASDGSYGIILPADRPSLPYTSALIRELLRWHPIVPIAGHRSGDRDDNNVIVKGETYRIPARSIVGANIWHIFHNPDVYESPEIFMPERFLTKNPPPEPETYAFGFGRSTAVNVDIN
ncbi:cytochrome P450 family protein [Ceratobasidium sp. AG-Ba]|nr:cytochrome P450 family protein [Ceratobasidium sp. AG-Ba]